MFLNKFWFVHLVHLLNIKKKLVLTLKKKIRKKFSSTSCVLWSFLWPFCNCKNRNLKKKKWKKIPLSNKGTWMSIVTNNSRNKKKYFLKFKTAKAKLVLKLKCFILESKIWKSFFQLFKNFQRKHRLWQVRSYFHFHIGKLNKSFLN